MAAISIAAEEKLSRWQISQHGKKKEEATYD